MASLTGQLSDPGTGGRAVDPGPGNGSSPFLSGLSKLAGGFIDGMAQRDATARANQESDWVQGERKAENDGAKAVFTALKGYDEQLSTAQTAESQGKVPPGTTKLKLEASLSEFMATHPGHEATAFDTFQKYGGHYLLSAARSEAAIDTQQEANNLERIKAYSGAAIKYGVATGNPEVDEALGAKLLQKEAEVAAAHAKLEAAAKLATTNAAAGKAAKETAGEQLGLAISQQYDTLVGGWVQKGSVILAGAVDDKDLESQLAEATTLVQSTSTAFSIQGHNELYRVNAPQAAHDQLDKTIAERKTAALAMFSDSFTANKRSVESITQNFKLDHADAFKLWGGISAMFGPAFATQYFSDEVMAGLPADVKEGIRQEAAGLNTSKTDKWKATIFEVGQVLKSGKALSDVSNPDAQVTAVRAVMASVTSEATQIAQGKQDDPSQFERSYSQIINTASDIPQNTTNLVGVYAAVDALTQQRNNTSLIWGPNGVFDKHSKDFPEIVQGSRGSAAKLQEILKNNLPTTGAFVISANRNGTYSVVPNKNFKAPAPMMVVDPATGIPLPTANRYASMPSVDITKQADALNKVTNFLVATAKFDSDVPKGATSKSLRSHYVNGTPLVDAKGEVIQSSQDVFDNWKAEGQRLPGQIASMALPEQVSTTSTPSFKGASISPGDAVSRLSGHGVPSHVAQGIVGNLMHESGLKTGAVGDGGKAISLSQWHPDRQQHARENGFDLSDPNDALDFVMWELNNTEPTAKKKLSEADTATEAASIFAQYFLRPKGSETGDANNILGISQRRKYAEGLASGG